MDSIDGPFDSNEWRRQLTLTGEAYGAASPNAGGVAFDGRLDVEADAGKPGDLNMLLSRVIGDDSDPKDCRLAPPRDTGDAGKGGEAEAYEERARREVPAKATLDRKEEEEIRDSPT